MAEGLYGVQIWLARYKFFANDETEGSAQAEKMVSRDVHLLGGLVLGHHSSRGSSSDNSNYVKIRTLL